MIRFSITRQLKKRKKHSASFVYESFIKEKIQGIRSVLIRMFTKP